MIAPLTKFFGITSDELLGLNITEPDARRDELETAYQETWQTGDLVARYKIADTAVREYPGDMKYLDWLAWTEAMRSFSFEDDATYKAEQEKAIKHFECVIKNATDERIKASSIVGIVQYLSFRSRDEEAKKFALLYPDNYSVSKDNVLLSCMQGDEMVMQQQKMLDRLLTDMLLLLGNSSVTACLAQEQILNALIPDKNYLYYHCFLADNYRGRAVFFVNSGEYDKAISMLKKSHYHAVEYDKFLNSTVYSFTSPFFNKVEHNIKNICRTGTTTQEEDFFEVLKNSCFDSIRERDSFKELITNL